MSTKEKTEKTVKNQSIQTTEVKSPVNEALYLILQNKRADLSNEQISFLLDNLRPYEAVDKTGKKTGWLNISGGLNDELLDGISFNLTCNVASGKKGKLSEKILTFRVRNIVKDVTRFGDPVNGALAQFSNLAISAYNRDYLTVTNINW